MEAYGKILIIAMPIFLLLVLLEMGYGWWMGRNNYQHMDTVSSLSSGVTNVVKDVLGLSISILTYSWMVKNWAVYTVQSTWVVYLVAFIALDFQGYWVHRLAHEINLFWNKHVIHHSSEQFNLACALRQSVSTFVHIFAFFLLPAALLGVPTEVIAVVAPIQLFAQFWYHTEHIDKMGWLEHIIVTPSHHRVHHALNKVYMDKNYAQIFIIWDKLFGTFQEELPDQPPVYGITRPANTWNPIKINFQHLGLLLQDAIRAQNWTDKLRIWFMPTGWRPADVEARYPLHKIDDPYNFEKYAPPVSRALQVWAGIQLLIVLAFTMYFFANIAQIGVPGMFYYGAFIFLTVYAYTELISLERFAWIWEMAKAALGAGILLQTGDWFELEKTMPYGTMLIGLYLVVSLVVAVMFNYRQPRPIPK
jgi:alkylglycerol monooxygenase